MLHMCACRPVLLSVLLRLQWCWVKTARARSFRSAALQQTIGTALAASQLTLSRTQTASRDESSWLTLTFRL